jgi:hypothetical protein
MIVTLFALWLDYFYVPPVQYNPRLAANPPGLGLLVAPPPSDGGPR